MNSRIRNMLVITIFFVIILLVKSLWLDPVGQLDGDMKKYHDFVLLNVESSYDSILKPIISYRIVDIKQVTADGETIILTKDIENNQWVSETLEGQYRAKIRFYFMHILPYRDTQVQIKGGTENGNQM